MLPKAPTKRELMSIVRRFIRNKERGISIKLFAQAAGVNHLHFLDVFWYRTEPLTEKMQIRVNKALRDLRAGRVKVMRRPDRTHYVDYRREDAPVMRPKIGLVKTADGIKIRIGMKNRSDYSDIDLDEAMRG